jgi:spore coat polysaccharide biosynthesis protein SpsF (cytidylyltransferase family)
MFKFKNSLSLGAIIIVRLKSKRLKNKVLLKIDKKNSIIKYIIIKLKKIFFKKNIILATSQKTKDKKLVIEAVNNDINFFKGEAIDVIKRIYLSAMDKKFKNIFICTGDNPLFDLETAKKMINLHIENKNDFTYAHGMPLGSYGWVLKTSSIKKILLLKKRIDTEIWGDFFLKNKKMKCKKFYYDKKKFDLSKIRLTIDEKPDLIFVKKILKLSKFNFPSLRDIEKILLKNREIIKINSKVRQKKKPKKIY